jgi:pimeloyl-ACP methyl ester carboxylesterase
MITIVLLPGMDGTGSLFADFVSALGKNFQPMIISYPKEEALGYEALEILVRNKLPTDQPFLLLGEFFSGPLAISLAASRPAGLVGLILSCSFVRNPIPKFRRLKWFVNFLPIKRKSVIALFSTFLGGFASVRIRHEIKNALRQVSIEALRARLRAVLETDYCDKLQRVQVPILYLKASHDLVVPPSALDCIQRLVPRIQIVSFRSPHLLLQALPVEAATVVKNFAEQTLPGCCAFACPNA